MTVGWQQLTRAVPDYQGGKRKLAPAIFKALEAAVTEATGKPAHRATLMDAFAGAGSISLLGKARGFRVISNDVSPTSEAVTRALVQNSRTQLTEPDVLLALGADASGRYLPPVDHLLWPEPARKLVAGILVAADEYPEDSDKRWLLRALAVKTALRISRYGQPRRMTLGRKLRDRRYDDITAGQAATMRYMTEPTRVALAAARAMDGVVFSNGRDNRVHRLDALDALRLGGEYGVDVAYLDPPYPGTASYEMSYVGLNALLEGRAVDEVDSRFSEAEGWRFLADVFDAATEVPVVILSLHNSVVDAPALVELMEAAGRDVVVHEHEHRIFNNALPSADKAAANRELVVVGTTR